MKTTQLFVKLAQRSALFFVLCCLPLRGAELSPDLRAAVDRLKADVERSPSDRDNAAFRMAVLWRWANAVSVAGGFVPKNLPLAAYYVPNPTPGRQLGARYLEAIDLYVLSLAALHLLGRGVVNRLEYWVRRQEATREKGKEEPRPPQRRRPKRRQNWVTDW